MPSQLPKAKVEDFEENAVFRTQILDRPEAAEVLVRLMETETPDLAARAREMLCLFDRPALAPLAAGLAGKGAMWRTNLLTILWTIISVHDRRDRVALVRDILPQIVPLLEDQDMISPDFRNRPEIEYEYRVCDEAYLFLRSVVAEGFDEGDFLKMDFEGRDGDIRLLRSRAQDLLV